MNNRAGNPSQQAITYQGMTWLVIAQFIVMLPFTLFLPWWLLPVLAFTVWWRWRVLKGQVSTPRTPLKLMLIAASIGALVSSGLSFPSLDVMVTLLLLGFALKTLETTRLRDALVVVFLGYFLTAVCFLYTQSILAALFAIIAMTVLTATLIGIQYPLSFMDNSRNTRHNLRLGLLLLLQCLPLMLLIFLLTPRLPPLFTLPLNQQHSKTGISDTLTPGDIASLSQSDALAFRVSFKGQRPAQNQLYWRGLVLNHFDGKSWRQFEQDMAFPKLKKFFQQQYSWRPEGVQTRGTAIEYEAIYEASGQPWLFTLTPSTQVDGDTILVADYRVMAKQELYSPTLLRATSYPDSLLDSQLSPALRELTLKLP